MSAARHADNKKKMGRPATGLGTLVGVRVQPEQLSAIDAWASAQPDAPSRPEAIRRLTNWGLKAAMIAPSKQKR